MPNIYGYVREFVTSDEQVVGRKFPDGRALVYGEAHGYVLAARVNQISVSDRVDQLVELICALELVALLNGCGPFVSLKFDSFCELKSGLIHFWDELVHERSTLFSILHGVLYFAKDELADFFLVKFIGFQPFPEVIFGGQAV